MDRRIESAIRRIHRDLQADLAIVNLAREVRLSHWHFIHLFKAETRCTPKQYILNLRMKRAASLLEDSFLSVKEIAAEVGFSDRSHFSREFKRYWGTSPSHARTRRRTAC